METIWRRILRLGYNSASHSLIAADGDIGKCCIGSALYLDFQRNNGLSTSSGDGRSLLYILFNHFERSIALLCITIGTRLGSDEAVTDNVENCSFQ